jgi:phosphatidylglycerophosphate synthase
MTNLIDRGLALPRSQRVLILVPISAVAALAFYFGVPFVVTAIIAPMFLIHFWRSQQISNYTRQDRPVMFWSAFSVFLLMTLIAFWELYRLFEQSVS